MPSANIQLFDDNLKSCKALQKKHRLITVFIEEKEALIRKESVLLEV